MTDLPAVLQSLSPTLAPDEIVAEMLRLPQADITTEHEFCPGLPGEARVYKRTMIVPAGTLVAGFAHSTACYNLLLKGRAVVWCSGKVMKIKAPYVFQSEPGAQKFGLFIEDSVWINFHATKETDIDRIESEIFIPSPALNAHRQVIEQLKQQATGEALSWPE